MSDGPLSMLLLPLPPLLLLTSSESVAAVHAWKWAEFVGSQQKKEEEEDLGLLAKMEHPRHESVCVR